MYEKAERWLSAGFFPALLLLFMVSFYMPISAKASNNIFYAGLAVPSVIWWLIRPRVAFGPYQVAPIFFALFVLLALTLGLVDVSFLKDSVYLVALFLVCVMLEQREGAVRRTFLVFSIVGLALLCVTTVDWLASVKVTGIILRAGLWGRTNNPIFAALMVISGLVFLWVFYLDERLCRRSRRMWWSGFLVFTGACAACVVIFQARSALLGFVLFLAGYTLQRGRIQAVLGALVIAVVALVVTDAMTLLLERGFSHRLEIWSDAIVRLHDECGLFAGCGKDQYRFLGQFVHPHSGYLSVLYYGGLMSFLVLVALAAAFFWLTWRTRSSWLLVALVGWGGVVAETNGIIASPRTLWVYFWIPTFMALIESGRPALEAYFSARRGGTVNSRG